MKRTKDRPFVFAFIICCSILLERSDGDCRCRKQPVNSAKSRSQEQNWTEAFKLAHEKTFARVPIHEWKDINWDSLFETFLPRIEQASAGR